MNRKERRLALRTAFQSRATELIVVEDFVDKLARPKTKELVSAIARWGANPEKKILLILAEKTETTETVFLSGRNVANLKILPANNINIFDVLAADYIVTTTEALTKIQEVYGD
jgi:large subunit ribosomal protein L4